jgi:hypothetical protein
MTTPLLSFLSAFENALACDDPNPDGGSWVATRAVNYHLGIARLELHVRQSEGLAPRGQVLLQGHRLADGTPCLKASLTWASSPAAVVRSIFTRPDVDWTREARKIASEWMAGPAATEEAAIPAAPPLAYQASG